MAVAESPPTLRDRRKRVDNRPSAQSGSITFKKATTREYVMPDSAISAQSDPQTIMDVQEAQRFVSAISIGDKKSFSKMF